jgi:hypothetical protein
LSSSIETGIACWPSGLTLTISPVFSLIKRFCCSGVNAFVARVSIELAVEARAIEPLQSALAAQIESVVNRFFIFLPLNIGWLPGQHHRMLWPSLENVLRLSRKSINPNQQYQRI